MDQPQFNLPTGLDIDTSNIGRQEIHPVRSAKKGRKGKSIIREYIETIVIALLAALILRIFVVSAYRVASGSMEDTLMTGDYIFVNKLAYKWSEPQPGDIIVFSNPYDPGRDYIKRIMATEGQTIEVYDKIVYVDNRLAPIPPGSKHVDVNTLQGALSPRDNYGPLIVPPDHVFVMGDNRDDSQDSRFWGELDKSYIKGKALFVYFSYAEDKNAPEWKAPYVIETFEVIFYNLFHFPERLRLGRIGKSL